MFNSTSKEVIIFLMSVFVLILFLGIFLIILAFRHPKKGLAHKKEIEELKTMYQNTLLQSQLEVQEQTPCYTEFPNLGYYPRKRY